MIGIDALRHRPILYGQDIQYNISNSTPHGLGADVYFNIKNVGGSTATNVRAIFEVLGEAEPEDPRSREFSFYDVPSDDLQSGHFSISCADTLDIGVSPRIRITVWYRTAGSGEQYCSRSFVKANDQSKIDTPMSLIVDFDS